MVHIRNITDAELCMRFLFWTWEDEYYIQSLLLCGRRPGLPAPGRTGNIQPKISVDQSGNGCGVGYPVFLHRRKYDYHAACIRIVPGLCARKESGGDWRIGSPDSSAPSVWRSTFAIWYCFV